MDHIYWGGGVSLCLDTSQASTYPSPLAKSLFTALKSVTAVAIVQIGKHTSYTALRMEVSCVFSGFILPKCPICSTPTKLRGLISNTPLTGITTVIKEPCVNEEFQRWALVLYS